jgi:pyrroloquinoline quinone biosynthesis protein B
LKAILLGAGAGGGFPQWNSAAPGCARARSGDPAALPRTQCSLAVSADGESWVLLNASPDIRAQIEATAALRPRRAPRHSPVSAVVLAGAEVDAIAGLLTLREGHAFALYAPLPVLRVLAANPIFNVLSPARVPRRALGGCTELCGADGTALGLRVQAFAVPGKVPLFAECPGQDPGLSDDSSVGLRVTDARGRALVFVPGCAAVTPDLLERMAGADCVLFDGTLWRDDEMVRAGISAKTGARMGHLSLDGPGGTLALLRPLQAARRVLVHINNSNPVLLADSPEAAAARAAGWEIGRDGMEIDL